MQLVFASSQDISNLENKSILAQQAKSFLSEFSEVTIVLMRVCAREIVRDGGYNWALYNRLHA